jgi:Skp family chaperone for outer membrane proteins
MRGFAIAVLGALAVGGVPLFAQPAAPAKPAAPPAAPATQAKPAPPAVPPKPAAPAAPAQPAAPPQPPPPPAPFPQGAKVAYVNLQAVAQLSVDGKAANAKVQALTQKKQAEIADKTKALQASQQKLQTGGSVMNEQARATLEKDIDRQTRELERLQQDAQADLTELQQELQAEFQKKMFPVLQQLSVEKGLHLLLNVPSETVIWGADGLDLTLEAVKKLDAGAKP